MKNWVENMIPRLWDHVKLEEIDRYTHTMNEKRHFRINVTFDIIFCEVYRVSICFLNTFTIPIRIRLPYQSNDLVPTQCITLQSLPSALLPVSIWFRNLAPQGPASASLSPAYCIPSLSLHLSRRPRCVLCEICLGYVCPLRSR